MHTKYLSILLSLVMLAIFASACGAATPTPRPATPTVVLVATLTPAQPTSTLTLTSTPTISATATLTSTATVTPTRASAATTRPAATLRATATTAFKPPAPRGSIAYHVNKDGVDRTRIANVETNPFTVTPLFDTGPVMDIAGTPSQGATNAHWGEWSPDNSKIAFILTSGQYASQILRVFTFSTSEVRDLDSSEAGGGLSSLTWSPAGDKIAYIVMSKDQRVWAVRKVFYNQTANPSDRRSDVRLSSGGEQYRGGLSWGKSGLLALGLNTTGASDVYTIDENGGGLGNLSNNPADDSTPAWSPDGKLIAFTSTRDGNAQIYVMNADGSGVRRLSKNNIKEFSPTWSPDGNWIAFTSTRDGIANIYIMDKNGGNAQHITSDGGDDPVWSH